MRFMVFMPGDSRYEADVLPDTDLLEAMGRYNEELVKAGVLLAGEGLQPTSKGVKVRFADGKRTVVDGPFSESKELIAGFWLWQVKSLEEAVEWAKRIPIAPDGGVEVTIRRVYEPDDFGDAFTPELRAAEEKLAAQVAARTRR
jgi:hypothetical protein